MGRLRERERELAAVEVLLEHRGGMLLVEGRAGIGKTSLVEVACLRAAELGHEVIRARGSELESGFAFGVVRQLFERRLAGAGKGEREALLAGPAAAVRPLLSGEFAVEPAGDSWFAVLHGLYWLVVNLAASRPLLIAVDDAHWADESSLRWLAYLAPRLEGLAAGTLVALRQGDPAVMGAPLLAVRAAAAVLRPALLSEQAVSAVVRAAAGREVSDELCSSVYAACGGNPLYLAELLRAADRSGRPLAALDPAELLAGGLEEIARLVITRVRGLLEETLQRAGPDVENWDTRAALLWVLVTAEGFGTVEESLKPMLKRVHRCGSARGFVAAYSTLGLLKLRLGALPEADAAARVALRVLQEGDFAPGLGFAATVLSDIAVEAGELDEAQMLLDLLPQQGWPAGVGTVLIPAARGRLRLAQGRPADALADFQACGALFGADVWGMPIRETGYVHARSGAALALLRLGQRQHACQLADAELTDVRVFGAPRSLGIALRTAGLARGGQEGLALLRESVAALDDSPALLERARSMAELGAALRRDGQRAAARDPLARALELAARCGARPLAKATARRPETDEHPGSWSPERASRLVCGHSFGGGLDKPRRLVRVGDHRHVA